MNHGCCSCGKDKAGSRVCFFSSQVTVRQATAIVRATAPNLLCSLVEHHKRGNLCLQEKTRKNSLLKSH